MVFLGSCGGTEPGTERPIGDLVGVWEVVERMYERGDSAWTEREPGLYLFADGFYAVQEIREADGPRPAFDDRTTDAERLAAFDVFHAHAGRYLVEGDRLLVTPTLAKGPNTMSGATHEYLLAREGQNLKVTRISESEDERRVTVLRRVQGPS